MMNIVSRYLGCFISVESGIQCQMGTNDDCKCSVLGCGFPLLVSTKKSVHLRMQENSSVNMLEGIVGSPEMVFPLEVSLRFLICWDVGKVSSKFTSNVPGNLID